uniref:Uncharacterized protein n=1 Tax=Arundo donax TaxID=35708 RepID=A0A0A9E5Y5_ARUDO
MGKIVANPKGKQATEE